METAEQPIRLRWLLKFFVIFLLALLLFLIGLTSKTDQLAKALTSLVIWAVLFLVTVLIRAKFSISFKSDGLYVSQIGKNSLIPYANIVQVYTNQDIADKFIGSKNLLLKINNPPEKIFGIPIIYRVGFPGFQGNIVTIPGLIDEDIARIKNNLLLHNNNLAGINDLGLGYPYYNKATLITNSFTIGLLIHIGILFIVLGLVYFYLKLTM